VKGYSSTKQQGFTLIEILLVLVIMTVLSAMVLPSFFQASGANVVDEARYMQKLLRLTAEEAQLSGKVIRCAVYKNHLSFASPNREGEWVPLTDKLFQSDTPKAPVIVEQAHLNGAVEELSLDSNSKKKPPLAYFLFWPDGRVSTGQITLSIADTDRKKTIQLHSGPGGIHIQRQST